MTMCNLSLKIAIISLLTIASGFPVNAQLVTLSEYATRPDDILAATMTSAPGSTPSPNGPDSSTVKLVEYDKATHQERMEHAGLEMPPANPLPSTERTTKLDSKTHSTATLGRATGNNAETQIINGMQGETNKLNRNKQSDRKMQYLWAESHKPATMPKLDEEGAEFRAAKQLLLPTELPRTTTNLMSSATETSAPDQGDRAGQQASRLSAAGATTSPLTERSDQDDLLRNGFHETVTDKFRSMLASAPRPTTMDLYANEDVARAAEDTERDNWRLPDGAAVEKHYLKFPNTAKVGEEDKVAGERVAAIPAKVDLVDLFPMKVADTFAPIIRDSNAQMLQDRIVFLRTDTFEHRQNLIPNDVDGSVPSFPEQVTDGGRVLNVQRSRDREHRHGETEVSEFTGKLLAERDGVITEIERKFQIDEYVAATDGTTSDTTTTSTVSTPSTHTRASSVSVNRELPDNSRSRRGGVGVGSDLAGNAGAGIFIDRRVKKNFEFPMHRAASDVMSLPHIDFASTKFNGQPPAAQGAEAANSASGAAGGRMAAGAHPEFSTTKFYNSKELYNEMLQHNMQTDSKRAMALSSHTSTSTAAVPTTTARPTMRAGALESAASRYAVVSSSKFSTYRLSRDFSKTATGTTATSHSSALPTTGMHAAPVTSTIIPSAVETTSGNSIKQATPGTVISSITPTAHPAANSYVDTDEVPKKLPKHANELNRAKLLLKVLRSLINGSAAVPTAASVITSTTPTIVNLMSTGAPQSIAADDATDASSDMIHPSVATTADNPAVRSSTLSLKTATRTTPIMTVTSTNTPSAETSSSSTGATTTTRKPTRVAIARPRIHYSRLQEKINSLVCQVSGVPRDGHLWRGNETHELLLPITSPAECRNEEDNCPPANLLSWEGEAEIQSGDILIVEIDDTALNDQNVNRNVRRPRNTQVYQVTRSGHENCDATEGILLDINPLVVDGRKLVTLYDKDLTEGTNLLIIVSELWGTQCVRLRVTTKTDNCGESAECSGKGVCYSSASMEEYECQCCNGFTGPHCEEIDACTPSPCTNNGICVDLSQGHGGHAYQCLCPYGYTGKHCQYDSDPCNSSECMNGGSCAGNATHFSCECQPGYTGPLCQHSLNECESSPCVHGICVDQDDGFRCFCQPGFAGELCNFEYNECESNPCQSSGECIDHIGGYECRCTKGYTGHRCQLKVDLCANKPCPEGRRCIDHGNDFSCDCTDGLNGPNCNQMPRTQCNENPCSHGGTCWTNGGSFYCACRAGYTGRMCENEFVIETVVSSSEFIVDDASVRHFNDRTYITSGVLKSPIELHNAYFAAGVLAVAIFIVAIVIIICQCRSTQSYRKFSTRSTSFLPILGFGLRPPSQSKLNRHWLIGRAAAGSLRSTTLAAKARSHLPASYVNRYAKCGGSKQQQSQQHQQQQPQQLGDPLCERPNSVQQQRHHLAMNLENDFYYTANFSEQHQQHQHHHSQHSSLID